jgi:signal peptidase
MTKISDADKANLKPGDIITYHAPIDINKDGQIGDINTHRIVSVDLDAKTVKTQGDNKETNPIADNYTVNFNDIIGTCTERGKISGIGSVIDFLRSSIGFLVCIVIPLALFFFYELYRFISLVVTERAKRAPVSQEAEEEIKRRAIEEYLASQKKAAENEDAPKEDSKTEE